MGRNSIVLGALLTILGVGTFALVRFDPGKIAALVPAMLGVLFLGCGIFALKRPAWKRHALLAAGLIAALGLIVMMPGLLQAIALFGDSEVANPTSSMEHGIGALLCAGFLGRGVVYYVEANRQVSEQF